jgi:hypothetical protein
VHWCYSGGFKFKQQRSFKAFFLLLQSTYELNQLKREITELMIKWKIYIPNSVIRLVSKQYNLDIYGCSEFFGMLKAGSSTTFVSINKFSSRIPLEFISTKIAYSIQ